MSTFEKQLLFYRKEKCFSNKILAQAFNIYITTIGEYECDEIIASLEANKKLVLILLGTCLVRQIIQIYFVNIRGLNNFRILPTYQTIENNAF